MKIYEGPYHCANPYPEASTNVASLKFDSSLVLYRPKEGLRNSDGTNPRAGEDLYLTGAVLSATWTDGAGQTHEICVPPGFVTDLTSVPAVFRWLVSRAGPWLEAAVLHDYLYVAWQSIPQRGARAPDRRFADTVMLAAMTAKGVAAWRRYLIFAAVRFGGGRGYRTISNFRFGDGTDPRLLHLAAVADLAGPGARTT